MHTHVHMHTHAQSTQPRMTLTDARESGGQRREAAVGDHELLSVTFAAMFTWSRMSGRKKGSMNYVPVRLPW